LLMLACPLEGCVRSVAFQQALFAGLCLASRAQDTFASTHTGAQLQYKGRGDHQDGFKAWAMLPYNAL
jgi:hypothetical protein